MLTILWRKADGSELLFTAKSIERLNDGEVPQTPVSGPFVAHGADMPFDLPGTDFTFSIEWPFGMVFVMNEEGRTVARYSSSPPAEVQSQLAQAA